MPLNLSCRWDESLDYSCCRGNSSGASMSWANSRSQAGPIARGRQAPVAGAQPFDLGVASQRFFAQASPRSGRGAQGRGPPRPRPSGSGARAASVPEDVLVAVPPLPAWTNNIGWVLRSRVPMPPRRPGLELRAARGNRPGSNSNSITWTPRSVPRCEMISFNHAPAIPPAPGACTSDTG